MTKAKPKIDIEVSILVGCSPEEIWAYLVDVSNETLWRDGVLEAGWVSDPPYGVGSDGLHVVEQIGDYPWRVAEWEEYRIMSWDVTGGRFEGAYAGYNLAPEGGGSRMTIFFSTHRNTFLKIMLFVTKRRVKRTLDGDLVKLKAIMEAK